MTVKIIKQRSLIAPLPGLSNVVEDGWVRYVSVNGNNVGGIVKFKDGDWLFRETGTRFTVMAGTQHALLAKLREHYA